jgi:hypothetical protein
MIQIQFLRNQGWWPLVACDTCGGPVNPEDGGLAIWSEADPPKPATSSGLTKPVLHVHAGDCDQRARERLDPPVAWEHLEAHLVHLIGTPAKGWRSTLQRS